MRKPATRKRYRFGSKRRDYLWWRDSTNAAKAGLGPVPICPHCGHPVAPDQPWDECHVGAPRVHGGRRTGVGHRACNQRDNNLVVTPSAAKAKRLAAIAAGQRGPGLGRHPMRAGRFSPETKTFRHGVRKRQSHAQKHATTMARLAIAPEASP